MKHLRCRSCGWLMVRIPGAWRDVLLVLAFLAGLFGGVLAGIELTRMLVPGRLG